MQRASGEGGHTACSRSCSLKSLGENSRTVGSEGSARTRRQPCVQVCPGESQDRCKQGPLHSQKHPGSVEKPSKLSAYPVWLGWGVGMGAGSALALFCELLFKRVHIMDFLRGPVVKTPPGNAGGKSLILGPGN